MSDSEGDSRSGKAGKMQVELEDRPEAARTTSTAVTPVPALTLTATEVGVGVGTTMALQTKLTQITSQK
ncbi:hypothetical protein [Catenulispora rubra]|uniref:hypothetical protein n=1 Tax=Catenulispora rubra TaxID=280293 RepID=UPI0018925CE4|nr:hypothetical protein [Catenulispora rubra]